MKNSIDIFNMVANIARPENSEPLDESLQCDHCGIYTSTGEETRVGYFCSPQCEKTWRKIAKEEEDNYYNEELEEYQND